MIMFEEETLTSNQKVIIAKLRNQFKDMLDIGPGNYDFGRIAIVSRLPMFRKGSKFTNEDSGMDYTQEEIVEALKAVWILTLKTLIENLEKA